MWNCGRREQKARANKTSFNIHRVKQRKTRFANASIKASIFPPRMCRRCFWFDEKRDLNLCAHEDPSRVTWRAHFMSLNFNYWHGDMRQRRSGDVLVRRQRRQEKKSQKVINEILMCLRPKQGDVASWHMSHRKKCKAWQFSTLSYFIKLKGAARRSHRRWLAQLKNTFRQIIFLWILHLFISISFNFYAFFYHLINLNLITNITDSFNVFRLQYFFFSFALLVWIY